MHDQTVKSARRVFEIFECFAEARHGLALKDIMDRLGYPASSASSILKSMVTLGYLDYDRDTHVYMPTLRMPNLVDWIKPARFAGNNVLPAMQRIHAVTGETVCLGTQSDLYAQYVHSLCSDRPAPYRQKPFTVRPLTRSGLGWLLLSAHSNDRIEHFVRRINYETLDRSERVRLPDLMERINKVRADGYVFSRHTVVVGGGMIGILIPDAPDGRRLAMSVHAPVERLEEKQDLIVSELRAAFPAGSEAGAAVH
ncbi:IclR family transcriptional regulator [Methylobacterium aquaticum]|uniref:IclR family transcriptional regulator n=1 Tax=Methylobacterium aquaticum TaxID=270351 RepID=UPI003D1844CF